jgi:2-dehydro-3-deoxyphosphooctonate aldolase (KDO 8-P synthase)
LASPSPKKKGNMTTQIKRNSVNLFDRSRLTVIAGPCMLESRDVAVAVLKVMQPLCLKLGVTYVFKASFDKANRTSARSTRGPGLDGLGLLSALRDEFGVPVLTDIHSPHQAKLAADAVDILQIPAFLCEDVALLQAAAATGRTVQIKKGQYLAPERLRVILSIMKNVPECGPVVFCERGTSLGYHNLVVDYRNLDAMRWLGTPVVFDATHAVQLPGAAKGASSGKREHIPTLARAAAAAGIDGLFMEVHPNPSQALSDRDTQLSPSEAVALLQHVVALDKESRRLGFLNMDAATPSST